VNFEELDDVEDDWVYRAPELFSTNHSPESDYFSLGMILLEMLLDTTNQSARFNVLQDFRDSNELPPAFATDKKLVRKLIIRLTFHTPSQRSTPREVLQSKRLSEWSQVAIT
jgi:serine/threonine protein kinase